MTRYKMKFFLDNNAYSISPAPTNVERVGDNQRKSFEWCFLSGDEISFDWDGGGKTAYLMFYPVGDHKRNLPFQVKYQPDKWSDALNDVMEDGTTQKGRHTLQGDKTIKIISDDHSEWSFDFNCKVGGETKKVDPEIKVRRNG